jgi:hypothetical protein
MYWWGTFAYHVDVPLAKSLAGRGRPALHWSIVPFSFNDGSAAAKNVRGLVSLSDNVYGDLPNS